jgi:Na+/H+ antiporter NhaA
MIGFIVGLFVGFYLGIALMSILAISGRAEERAEQMRRKAGLE